MINKGFTLVELLAVIIILSIIFVLVFPTVNDIISEGENTVYQKQINSILDSTYNWSLKNYNYLPNSNEKIYITLSQLINTGYINSNIIDPKTNKNFNEDLVISITNVGGNYHHSTSYSKTGGDFLYMIEYDFMSTNEYLENKPIIVFDGLDYSDDNIYTEEINIGDNYVSRNYTATSISSQDLSSSVITNIIYNNIAVSSVNTNKIGIYHINYTVIDSNGYSTTAVRNIIITDTQLPVLTIPSNITISSNLIKYDLMDGASCTDNSGECTIKIDEQVAYGVPGKYVVTYIAKDSSSNTVTSNRIITIE